MKKYLYYYIFILTLLNLFAYISGACGTPPTITGAEHHSIISDVSNSAIVYSCVTANNKFQTGEAAFENFCDPISNTWDSVNHYSCVSGFTECTESPTTPLNAKEFTTGSTKPNKFVVFECNSGNAWLSGSKYRISQCADGKWSLIYDTCDETCYHYPSHCGEVSDLGLTTAGIYRVIGSGVQDDASTTVRCPDMQENWTEILRMCKGANAAKSDDSYKNGFAEKNDDLTTNHFVGLNYLNQLSTKEDLVLEINLWINTANTQRVAQAVYSNFKVGVSPTYTLESIGDYHGNAGDGLCPHVSEVFTFNNAGDKQKWWGYSIDQLQQVKDLNGSFLTDVVWGQLEFECVTMNVRPRTYELTLCPAYYGFEPSWADTTKLDIPYTRWWESAKITYECIGDLMAVKDGDTISKTGEINCIEADASDTLNKPAHWEKTIEFPCQLQCPASFNKSSTADICYHFSENTQNSVSASESCISLESSLAAIDQDLVLDTTNTNSFLVTHTSRKTDHLTDLTPVVNGATGYTSTAYTGDPFPYGCTTVKSDKTYILSSCTAATNYICQIPGVCSAGYSSVLGGCYKVIDTTGKTIFEASAECAKEGSSLAWPWKKAQVDALQEYLKNQGKTGTTFIGLNTKDGTTHFNGIHHVPDDDLITILDANNEMKYRLLNEYGQTDVLIPADGTETTSQALCQFHGQIACESAPPSNDQTELTITEGSTSEIISSPSTFIGKRIGTEAKYTCDKGYFMSDDLIDFERIATCRGQLGEWLFPNGLTLELCTKKKVCHIEDVTKDEHVTLASTDEMSGLIDSTVTYTCPANMQMLDGTDSVEIKCEYKTDTSSYGYSKTTIDSCTKCTETLIFDNAAVNVGTSEVSIDDTKVICKDNFEYAFDNKEQIIKCTLTGWDKQSIKPCVQYCSATLTEAADINLLTPALTTRTIGSFLTYKCSDGMSIVATTANEEVVSEFNVTCGQNSEWETAGYKTYADISSLKCSNLCAGDLPDGTDFGIRSWNGIDRAEGTKVNYTCEDTALHGNLETIWTVECVDKLWKNFDEEAMKCKRYCNTALIQPKDGSNLTAPDNPTLAEQDVTIVIYKCLDGMVTVPSGLGQTQVAEFNVICNSNGEWESEVDTFKYANIPQIECSTLCSVDLPSKDDNGQREWNQVDRKDGTQVKYTCNDDYLFPDKNNYWTVICKEKIWENLMPEKMFCAQYCLEDPPQVDPTTSNVEAEQATTHVVSTELTYKCKDSMFFIPAEPIANIAELKNETIVKCGTDRTWQCDIEDSNLKCGELCMALPPDPPNNANTSWDGTDILKTLEIIYTCNDSYRFPDEKESLTLKCSDDGQQWTPYVAEEFKCLRYCGDLPDLPETDRDESITGLFLSEELTYNCSNGFRNKSGEFNITLKCLETGLTEYPNFKCEKACPNNPPDPPANGNSTFDGSFLEGTIINYHCPGYFVMATYSVEFKINCTDSQWTPNTIPPCLDATTTTKAPETVNPLLDAQFYADTNPIIIIENINQLNSSTDQPLNVTDTPVPFGTGITLNEEAKQCAKWDNFQNAQCVTNPRSCIDVGFSFSIWAKVYEVAEDNVEKRYLISTGGTTDGHPGVAIYVQADWLYSLVSIGEKYWLASAFLHVPNEQWSVIAVTLHNDDKGLITYIYKSDYREMKQLSQQSVPETAESKVGLSPPEIMFGCHKTSDNPEYRDFITADLDSFVVWQTPVVNEKWFTGGYSEENRTIEELVELLNNMEEQIPPDVSDAIVDLAMIMMQEEEKKEAELAETSSTSTEEIVSETSTDEMVDTDNIENLLIIIKQLINLINCPSEPKAESDIGNGVKPLELLSKSMDPSDSNVKKWKEVTNKDSANEFMNIFMQSVDFVHCNAISIQIEEDTFTYSFADKNLYTYVSKNKVDQLNRRDKVVIPSYNTELDDAHTDIARVAVWATRINDGRCENRTFTLTIQSAPTGFALHALIVNKRELNHNERLEIDSPVTGIRAETDPVYDENGVIDTSQPECGYGKLSGYKIDILIPHESKVPEIRSRNLLFFEESVHTEVIKRYCALWNKDIEKVGAWDISKCKIGETSSNHTRCLCAEDGLIVIIAHLKEKVEVPKDPAWLVKTQRALYIASAICIVIYAIVVLLSGDLKDQFHLAGLNLAIAIIMGHAAMYASEYEEIAENREACGWVSTAIYYFYLSVGTWIMALGHCCFKAITAGVISGKLHTYVCMAWGFSLTCLGLVMMFYLHDIGTDPRCFVAWEDEVKLTLLGPQAAFSLIAVFLTFVILCNLSTPALRKDNLIDDYGSFCKGAAFLMFVYGLTWIFAIFAYLRLDIDTDFYPIFTVLNSAMGVFLFLFIGLGSNRFRMVILGQAKTRRNMLKNYAFGLPGRSKPRPLK